MSDITTKRGPADTTRRAVAPGPGAWLWAGVLVGAALAGCAGQPTAASSAGKPASAGTAPPAPGPGRPAPPPPANPPPPASARAPAAMGEAEQRAAVEAARNLLEQGREAEAVAELQRVLAADPRHKAAQHLLRQVREDARALLAAQFGSEAFPHRVVAGDSMGSLAQRYLGDRDLFYALARFNDLKVPRQLAPGQTIRVPGKPPRPVGETSKPQKPEPTRPEPKPPEPKPPEPKPPGPPKPVPMPPVEAAVRAARTAMARQDVCGAIAGWKQVLSLDPKHRSAPLELERAETLKRKLNKTQC